MQDSLLLLESSKSKMKNTNQRTETDRLWVRIESLQWALAQILALRGFGS